MIRAEILVEGEVQKVGYRDFVQKVARRLGVKGYVENLEDGNVLVVCEVDETALKNFVKEIDVKGELTKVEKVTVVERPVGAPEFKVFRIKYGALEEELGEGLCTFIEVVWSIKSDIKAMHSEIKAMYVDSKESIDSMHEDLAEKITGVKEEMKSVREEMSGVKEQVHQRQQTL